jgi:NAD(P)-dependent dehydrogenase (short-subunit alcohol dehydrogenase family)
MLLSNRVAVITGAARGIGKGIALRFAEEGCSVAIADLLEKEGRKTAEEISAKSGESLFVKCDVSKSAEVQAMVDQVINRFGKVDILVNNAGIGALPKPFTETPEEEWDRVLAINLKGVFLCCKAAAPHMKNQKYGKIINIASLAAVSPRNSPLPASLTNMKSSPRGSICFLPVRRTGLSGSAAKGGKYGG